MEKEQKMIGNYLLARPPSSLFIPLCMMTKGADNYLNLAKELISKTHNG